MFGRAEKDDDHVPESIVTAADSQDARGDVERASREFLAAHAAVVAFSLAAGLADSQPALSLPPLKLDRDRALSAVRRHRACNWSDIQAKMKVFFALEDWFGCEENAVAELSAEILHEAAPFLAAEQAKVRPRNLAQQASRPLRPAWFDRLPRLSRYAQKQSSSE